MKFLMTLAFFILTIHGFSQSGDKSKELLDQVSSKISSYKNIDITFDYHLDNDKERVHQKTSGTVKIMGQKYHLYYMGIEKIFDGSKVYSILHEDEEVVISNPASEDEEFSPGKILSFYKKGYRYNWDKEVLVDGKKIQYVSRRTSNNF